MIDFIIYFIAFLVTAPIIATVFVYKVSVKVFHHKWKAIHFAANWTTLFYIIAVIVLLEVIFEHYFIGILLSALLSILAVIIFVQWKTKTEIVLIRGLKILWRFCFLLFSMLYICLVLFGIIDRILFY